MHNTSYDTLIMSSLKGLKGLKTGFIITKVEKDWRRKTSFFRSAALPRHKTPLLIMAGQATANQNASKN
jgi:hypothetical protein